MRAGVLEGRVAVITGSGKGIGEAIARDLAGQGVRLGLASRSGNDLGIPDTVALPCDVRDPAQVRSVVDATVARFGGIDILVANAGVGSYASFLDLDPEHIDKMIDTNVKGTIYAVRSALPHLLKSDDADILTISSEAGRRGFPGETVYCGSKFAQVGFTRALDGELREKGVRCTNVCPGGVATEFAIGRGRNAADTEGMMSAGDVAELVRFILTRPRGMRILETALRPVIEAS